jgi:hypothetical protein
LYFKHLRFHLALQARQKNVSARQKLPIAEKSLRPHLLRASQGDGAMKVGETGGPRNIGGTKGVGGKGAAKGGDFAKLLDGGPRGPEGTSGPTAAYGIGAVFGAQEVEDSTNKPANNRARQRGEDMLDKLDALRQGLLTGSMSRGDLLDLAKLVRARQEAGADPQLREILGEIELRAAVELAKLESLR